MYKSKTTPFKHQQEALDKSWLKKNFAYFMEMGCFTGDVEVLTNRGFMRFDSIDPEKLERPFLVAQVTRPEGTLADWAVQFTEPESFIHKKDIVHNARLFGAHGSDYFGKTRTCFGMTPDHRIPTFENTEDYTAKELEKGCTVVQKLRKSEGRESFSIAPAKVHVFSRLTKGILPSTSKYFVCPDPELAQLTPAEIRFMVAVIADGTYPNKTDNKVDFDFVKRRKFERLQKIAAQAGIRLATEVKFKSERRMQPHYIAHAIAPVRYKKFSYEWYYLNPEQIKAVAEEACYWDGTVQTDQYVRFYSTVAESIDFVQFALFVNGCGSKSSPSLGSPKYCYQINATATDVSNSFLNIPELFDKVDPNQKGFGVKKKEPSRCLLEITPYSPVIENKIVTPYVPNKEVDVYCLRVPSGYFIARHDGNMFITGNSGKTKVMIDNIGMLYDKKAITGALILAPKGVYQNWSQKEIPTHLSDDIPKEVLVWDAGATEKRKKQLAQDIQNWDGSCLQIMVFNIESLITEKGHKLIEDFIKKHQGKILALVDESTCIKNHKAKRTKEAIKIGSKCIARRIATGSPVTNSPLDLYAQCAFLDKSLLGHGSYYSFRNTYANIERVMNRQGQSYDKILNYKNLDELSEKIGKFSYRVTKKECLDLPDKIYQTRVVELTPEQKKIYKEMADSAYTFLVNKDGSLKEMSSRIVLTKLLRLHQVLCGIFMADDGTLQRLPNHRLEELKNILDETQGKVIIWATYIPNIEDIAAMLEKEYGKDSFVTYYGDTLQDDRNEAILKFQDEESPVRFFLGNVQTAGRGITLTAASTVVYYANNFSLEFRQQSEDRAHRVGQKNNVTYIDLMVPYSMDEKIVKALINKKNIAEEVMKDKPSEWITLKRGDEA